jgi:diadenosine tetraphosphate (Ap4A) HIT family hydrolase
MTLVAETCAICQIHGSVSAQTSYEIGRGALWVLRHHPDPSPLLGWLLLDSARHLGGPVDFNPEEAAAWGVAVQHASALVKELTGCDRVYAISFGEGAPHLHLHLIPRFASDPHTAAWSVADHYRAVIAGERNPANPGDVADLVVQARQRVDQAVLDAFSPRSATC